MKNRYDYFKEYNERANAENVQGICKARAAAGMSCRGCKYYKTGHCDRYGLRKEEKNDR